MSADLELKAAVQEYLRRTNRLGKPRLPVSDNPALQSRLDVLIDLASRWKDHEVASIALILALSWRHCGREGLRTCLAAMEHALAKLGIDLPLDDEAATVELESLAKLQAIRETPAEVHPPPAD